MFIKNKAEYKTLRKNLRKNQTEAERIIWNMVRNRQIQGLKFFRQYGVGPYIVDFCCPDIKLVIEADGGQHNEELDVKKDAKRTDYLNSLHITVIRFWNNDVVENREGVYDTIVQAVNSSRPPL